MNRTERYPHSLKSALQESRFENILDANMFTAYIPRDLSIPRFIDPRKTLLDVGTYRQPGHVRSRYINQVFSCIGYIKRMQNMDHLKYLPILYEELGRFFLVMEDITYSLDIRTPLEIYDAQKRGLGCFLSSYQAPRDRDTEWIDKIRKHQLLYLEKIDTLIETLKTRGSVFDCSKEPLYAKVLSICHRFANSDATGSNTTVDTGCRFLANCCAKAARDGQSKVIWSGDTHILKLLQHIYTIPEIRGAFPQIYMRSSYDPMNFAPLFPRWHASENKV